MTIHRTQSSNVETGGGSHSDHPANICPVIGTTLDIRGRGDCVCCVLGSLGGVVVIEVIIMVQIKCKCPLCSVFTAYLEHEHGPADDL